MKWGSILCGGLFGGLMLAGNAHAQSAPAKAPDNPNCPPNAYCQTGEVGPPEQASRAEMTAAERDVDDDDAADTVVVVQRRDGSATVELPPRAAGEDPRSPRTFTYVPPSRGRPGQVIIYDDGVAPPNMEPGLYEPPPRARDLKRSKKKKRKDTRLRRWGIGIRANAAALPRYQGNDDTPGMFGIGVSMRYRPVAAFALDFGADFLGGRDSNGYQRQEMPFSSTAMFYLNPRDTAQVYLQGGASFTFARIQSDQVQLNLSGGDRDDYTYVGGHLGGGVEIRLSQSFGLALDVLGYVRTRTDGTEEDQQRFPEYFNRETGDISNTSVGGMGRAGLNFWW